MSITPRFTRQYKAEAGIESRQLRVKSVPKVHKYHWKGSKCKTQCTFILPNACLYATCKDRKNILGMEL